MVIIKFHSKAKSAENIEISYFGGFSNSNLARENIDILKGW